MFNKLLLMTGSTFALLLPIKGLLLLIFIMILVDTSYAIYASIKLHGYSSFKSSILRKGLTPKVLGYIGTTILMYAADVIFFGGVLMGINFLLSKSIGMLWVFTEFKSLNESNILMGGKPFVDRARELIKFITKAKKEVGEVIEVGSEGDKEESTK